MAIKNKKNYSPNKEAIINQLEKFQYGSHDYHPLLAERYDMVRLYLAGKSLNNDFIIKYAINSIIASNLFNSVYNHNFLKHEYGHCNFRKYRNDYITKISEKQNKSSMYAIEKIGYWEDWDAKNWFPEIFKQIDIDLPRNSPYDIRILAHSIKDLPWKNMLIEQNMILQKWLNLRKEDLSNLDFE